MKFLSGQHSAVPRTQRFDVHKAPSTASRWSASSISLPAGLKVVCLAALLAALAGCKKEDRQSIEVAGPTAQATANVAATETTPSYRKAGLSYEVFWDRGDHICSLAINMDSMAGAMAMYEAQSGRRVVSFRPFSDGVIAELNSGWEEVLWYKEIDCKDPPYDPLATSADNAKGPAGVLGQPSEDGDDASQLTPQVPLQR